MILIFTTCLRRVKLQVLGPAVDLIPIIGLLYLMPYIRPGVGTEVY